MLALGVCKPVKRDREIEIKGWRMVSKVRAIAAWIIIPAFISMFVAHQSILSDKYCCMPWPPGAPNRPPDWMFTWRNYSLLLVVAASIITIPRWQALVGIAGTLIFLFLYGSQ